MKLTPIYSILLLSILLLTMIPFFALPETSNALESPMSSPQNNPTTLASSRSSIDYKDPSPSNGRSHDSRELPSPDIPTSRIGQGNLRAARLDWNLTQPFTDRDDVTDFQVTVEKGNLYHEITGFDRIGDIMQINDFVVAEDYNVNDGTWWVWPLWHGEVTFMAFNISGKSPCHVDGFAIYAESYPGSASSGLLNYTVFAAEPNSTSGHGTKPDVALQVVPWMQMSFNVPMNTQRWVTLDAYLPVILDSAMTYANTFYLAIALGDLSSELNWVLMDDLGDPPYDVPPYSDYHEDDGDAWWYDPSDVWPNLTFESSDFFLNVGITRQPYPSEIGMMVNSTPVWDLYPYPGIGYWDGGWFSPGINMTMATRYFDVTYFLPGTTYDATWLGWFYETLLADSTFKVYPTQITVDWNTSLIADFPTGAMDQTIYIHVEADWTVVQVLHDGVSHGFWSKIFSNGHWWLKITNADDGEWIGLFSAPNYVVNIFVRDQNGWVVDWVYAADWVYPTGIVQDPVSGINATSGIGWLFVYDPSDADHYNRTVALYPAGAVEFYWPVWYTVNGLGVYTLHIIWSNGYQAGMNSTTLTVLQSPSVLDVYNENPEPGKDVVRGQRVIFDLYYGDYMWYGLPEATVTVMNDSSGMEWEDYTVYNWGGEGYHGYYSVVLETVNATVNVQHNITLHIVQIFYDEQTHTKNFTIISNEAHIVFFLGSGLDNSTGVWRTTPEPFINTSNIVFTILYTDDAGIPHAGAVIEAYLIKGPAGDRKIRRLPWEDLSESTQTPGSHGKYQITVDTNPILGDAFHEGEEAFIIIYAYHYEYEEAVSDYIYVRPQPRPTWIDVPIQYQQIVLYENWTYPTIEHPVILRVILRDSLNGEDLCHGVIEAEVPGVGNITLNLATPGLGLYEIPSLETHNLSPGTYNMTLRASARDFVDSFVRITLVIRPKESIYYTCTPTYSSTLPNQGQHWQLNFQFYLENSSSSFASDASKQGLNKQTGIEYLPPGTKVTLSITVGGTAESLVEYIGEYGQVSFEGVLAIEGNYRFYLSIEGSEHYADLSNAPLQLGGSSFTIQVVSLATLISSNLPTIGIIGAVILFIPLGSVLSYRRYVVLPKRRKRLAKYQAIADTFSDVANLNRLLVLHKESGICVFDPFAEESQDATLVAGFLQAISTFGHDLADSPGLTNGEKTEATALRELQYEGFRILIHDGAFVRNALVLGGTPSEQLRERLENFTKAFEARYKGDFEHWSGRVDQFNSASDLVEEIFLISLRHPHTVVASKPRGAQLTSLESDIYRLSKELTVDRQYVFLGQVLSTYLAAGKASNLEALMAIYQLRVKGLFEPIHLPPIVSPSRKAG